MPRSTESSALLLITARDVEQTWRALSLQAKPGVSGSASDGPVTAAEDGKSPALPACRGRAPGEP
ncbi:MAG: hypothetical protein JWN06_2767 [Propionibacteriaceae bacterium]|nr:hypothetical protein [Propionibacteriaceae bacterium]